MRKRTLAGFEPREEAPARPPHWHWVPADHNLWALAVPNGHVRIAGGPARYVVTGHTSTRGAIDLDSLEGLEAAKACAEVWASGQGAEHLHRHDAADTWRSQPASDGQRARLHRQGVAVPPMLSKGHAADLSLAAEVRYAHDVRQFFARPRRVPATRRRVPLLGEPEP
jgi:hypothetical protein